MTKQISQNTEYQILTSNAKVKNYEKLNYQISVIKDQFPIINVNNAPDSLNVDKNYVLGQISDDYGLSKLQVVYYPKNKPESLRRGTIAIKSNILNFISSPFLNIKALCFAVVSCSGMFKILSISILCRI